MRHRLALGLVVLLVSACASDGADPSDRDGGLAADPRPTRDRRFAFSVLLSDSAVRTSSSISSCNVSVRPPVIPTSDWAPETNLELRASPDTVRSATVATDATGVAALLDQRGGVQNISLRSDDGFYRGRLAFISTVRRTRVWGAILADDRDYDRDGQLGEGLLVVDVIPDSNGDGVSDTGEWSRFVFDERDGLVFRHRADGTTEESRLDENYDELDLVIFDDRDGDLLADADDPDIDGDGVDNGAEGGSLPCPGFSHEPLFADGSEHSDFKCDRCHGSGNELTPLRCDDCHTPGGRSWEETPDDAPEPHFLRGCEMCHRADESWREVPGPEGEDHAAFPLLGLHLQTNCYRCHESGNPKPESICADCHLGEAGPDHYQADCQACHSEAGWKPSSFDHDHFPLSGGHADVGCDACHAPPDYALGSTDCSSCHLEDAPDKHAQPGFDQKACDDCHNIGAWTEFNYPHTQWLLEGLHIEQTCTKCHEAPSTYEGNDGVCASCHEVPAFPAHDAFSNECERCHTPERWTPASAESFDHAVFPLVDAHAVARCGSCHEDGALPRPSQECAGCHEATRPPRHAGVFDGDCGQCHKPRTWPELDPPYTHTPSFPLEGIHANTLCSSCHTTSYQAEPACVRCHVQDSPPNHYGQDCETCHGFDNWNPKGEMNHHTADPNAFPLTFGHANTLCSQCHVDGFSALPSSCETCHNNDVPLGHATANCEQCHASGVWTQPTQPTANDFHPLQGGHVNPTCVDCHGAYGGTGFTTPAPSSACTTCHVEPAVHAVAAGASPCDSCHSIDAWVPASGGHGGPVPTSPFPYDTWSVNWFPDGSTTGTHHGANQCSKCHVQPNNFSFFSCTDQCHGDLGELQDDHKNGVDEGNEAKKQFHLYHYSPLDQNMPPDEGGAIWATGHVGCVNRSCHPRGRKP